MDSNFTFILGVVVHFLQHAGLKSEFFLATKYVTPLAVQDAS